MQERSRVARDAKFLAQAQETLFKRVNESGRNHLIGDEFTHLTFRKPELADQFYSLLKEAFRNFSITFQFIGDNRYNYYIHEVNAHYRSRLDPVRLSLIEADAALDWIRRSRLDEVALIDQMIANNEFVNEREFDDIPVPFDAAPDELPPPYKYQEIDESERPPAYFESAATRRVEKKCIIL